MTVTTTRNNKNNDKVGNVVSYLYRSKFASQFVSLFREMRVMRLVKTNSLYFPKARALRHTSALLRYNAHSLRYRYERAQFTIRTSLVFLKNSRVLT